MNSHPARPSVIIVGGGVFGMTAALELHARGWRVTVLDQGRMPHPDAATTDISKVIRMDYGADAIYTEMGEQSLSGWCAWNAAWHEPLFHQDGFLVMTRDAEMRPGGFEHDSYHFLRARDHELKRMRADDLRRDHPAWNADGYHDGYFNPTGGWAESGRVLAVLKGLATGRGIEVHEERALDRLLERGSKVVGARDSRGHDWHADHVLVAAGSWTPFVLPHLRGVLRTTGQPVVHLRPADPRAWRAPAFPVWGADIGRTGWYGFPANAQDVVKVANHGPGVPVERADQPRVVTETEIARFRAFLRDTFPALADAPLVSSRQCWYCDSMDGDFLIAHDPGRAGLIVAAGDSGHAFKFAPVLGALIADVVERRSNPWAARFAWRTCGAFVADGARAVQ